MLATIIAAAGCATSVDATDPGRKSKEQGKCGGLLGLQCEDGLWCDLRAPACTGNDLEGVCIRVPEVCAEVYLPVCGCDGKIYSSDCHRQTKKIHKNHDGECAEKK